MRGPHRDHIRARRKDLLSQRHGNTATRRRVLGVDHHGMHRALRA